MAHGAVHSIWIVALPVMQRWETGTPKLPSIATPVVAVITLLRSCISLSMGSDDVDIDRFPNVGFLVSDYSITGSGLPTDGMVSNGPKTVI